MKHFEFNFKEFDRGTANGDFGFGDESGRNKGHCLDWVFTWVIFDIFVDFLKAFNLKSSGADAVDFDTKFL